ncbi:hypothetical protein [Nonomuraea pusilla]|uniref:Uncharacterized protein n=1 Tax=Nonomuraea pusilla TaxID=46177 RepID=A0A1H8IYM9_9ACTN|nr:hypothetical protein [Nonomuraea pusilla]SEN73007.1 hypothetical protein SAMN05660976_08180 [Nonomuraea pusilla]
MTRWTWGCLVAVVLPFFGALILVFGFVMPPVWRDDDRLDALLDRVLTHPLPPETSELSDQRDADFGRGLFGGNGDYCDYRIRIVLQTKRTQEEIRRHYGKATIKGAEENATLSLFFEDTGDTSGRRVIVEVTDRHGSDWDWRCT